MTSKLISNEDIGESLEITNEKLEVKQSQLQNNLIEVKEDGVFAELPVLGTMSQEDKDNYLTKTSIEDTFQSKDDIQGDLTEYAKTADFTGKMGLEDKTSFYDKKTINTKIDNLPADKFLNSAELVDNELVFKVKDSDDVTVDVSNLIPVSVDVGVTGDGTTMAGYDRKIGYGSIQHVGGSNFVNEIRSLEVHRLHNVATWICRFDGNSVYGNTGINTLIGKYNLVGEYRGWEDSVYTEAMTPLIEFDAIHNLEGYIDIEITVHKATEVCDG